jgi:multidrug efflux pump
MTISKLAVDNRVTIYILIAIIILFGAFSYATLPKESSPSITIPYVFVSTVYFGVAPQDIENLVTKEIENEVKGIKDVKEITSISRESFSSVTIEFNTNVEIEDALQKVRDKVSIAKTKMPSDIEEPMITEINISELPMLYINLSGNFGLVKLKDIGDNLADKIEQIPGVLGIDVTGGLEREVKVNVNADKLKYYNIGFDDINNAIRGENIDIPGGNVEFGTSNYLVRVPGEFKNPDLINDVVIKAKFGKPIYVRDVAEVVYGYKERTTFARENGIETVTLVIKKRSGENIIEISDKVKELIAREKKNLPPGLNISFTGDESKFIRTTVHELENGVITGFLLVTIVLLAAMGLRNALFVAAAIPMSFLITFSILNIFGITLNMIVLFSLILVLGIVVDDAIVVTENIFRLQQKEDYNPYDAAIEGPREVQVPVLIATLTIISSFFPILFYPGIVGEFMQYLPITLIIALFSSLFVALVLNPVFAARFINYKKDLEKSKKSQFRKLNIFTRFHHWFDGEFEKLTKHYEKVLRFALRKKYLTIGGVFAMLILVFILFGMFNRGVEFFPTMEPQQAFIQITMPIGTNIEKTNEVTATLEKQLPPYKDLEYYVANVGSQIGVFEASSNQSNKSTITLNFYDKEDRLENSLKTVEQMRKSVTGITTGEIRLEKQEAGPPTGAPISIEIAGDDFEKLGALSDQIKREINNIPNITNIKDDYEEARPEIKIIVEREKAALYNLNTSMIASTIRTAINGTDVSKYREGEDEFDITVRLDSVQRNDISKIQNLYVADRDGLLVPLTSVAKIDFSGGLGAIKRIDLKRVVTITADAEGRLPNDVLNDVKAKLVNFNLPEGYLISYTGQQEEQEESSKFLMQAFLISLLMIFFFMVLEFNSIKTPMVIMFSVLLSLIGVLIGLLVTFTPFSIVMTGIGVISLGGIVVRNAIVLLDFQKELEKRGMNRYESVVQSGVIRLRPVVLTAITTILGLVPLTTGVDFDWRTLSWIIGGQNTAFWRPMGVAIIFGLSVSTFLTLIVVPSIFLAVSELRDKFKRKTTKTAEIAAQT